MSQYLFLLIVYQTFFASFASNYRSGYFMLTRRCEGNYKSLNSLGELPCVLDCLDNEECKELAMNNAKCAKFSESQEEMNDIEIWRKMRTLIKGMPM